MGRVRRNHQTSPEVDVRSLSNSADVGFDGDWVTPYQISSSSAHGPVLVALHWLDEGSIDASKVVLQRLGFLPDLKFDELLDVVLSRRTDEVTRAGRSRNARHRSAASTSASSRSRSRQVRTSSTSASRCAQVISSSVAVTRKPLSASSLLRVPNEGSSAPIGRPVRGSRIPFGGGVTSGWVTFVIPCALRTCGGFRAGARAYIRHHRRLNARLADIGFICGIGRSVVYRLFLRRTLRLTAKTPPRTARASQSAFSWRLRLSRSLPS